MEPVGVSFTLQTLMLTANKKINFTSLLQVQLLPQIWVTLSSTQLYYIYSRCYKDLYISLKLKRS